MPGVNLSLCQSYALSHDAGASGGLVLDTIEVVRCILDCGTHCLSHIIIGKIPSGCKLDSQAYSVACFLPRRQLSLTWVGRLTTIRTSFTQ
jgi:hypothetical protein